MNNSHQSADVVTTVVAQYPSSPFSSICVRRQIQSRIPMNFRCKWFQRITTLLHVYVRLCVYLSVCVCVTLDVDIQIEMRVYRVSIK